MILDPSRTPLVSIVTTDIAGITRGRSIPASRFEHIIQHGVGWVPANQSLTPFDVIADPNPWGSRGDLRLIPDPDARFSVVGSRAATPIDMVMASITDLDGAPWEACPRSFLKSALADFEAETKLRLWSAFELEFQIVGADWPAAPAFSLQALRRADPFGPELIAALEEAGVHPEVFLAEYGRDQFEIACEAAEGVVSADRAVAIREIVREIARLNGLKASFAPKTSVDGVGSGVHVHLSFRGSQGEPALYDTTQPGRLSRIGGAFCAGILHHLPALTALTAPSVASFLRLQPHHWSAAWTWLGERDRESSLRICPTVALGGRDAAKQFNIEYRAADAAACPHMVLAAIVRAGLEGIRGGLPCPPIVASDPAALSDQDRSKLGLRRLPETLASALDALEQDKKVCGWFSPAFLDTYLGMKRYELNLLKDLDDAAMLARYAEVY